MVYKSAASHFFALPPPSTDSSSFSLLDALPISTQPVKTGGVSTEHLLSGGRVEGTQIFVDHAEDLGVRRGEQTDWPIDRKSTRLNSSHLVNSYAVFCLKKKKAVTMVYALYDRSL